MKPLTRQYVLTYILGNTVLTTVLATAIPPLIAFVISSNLISCIYMGLDKQSARCGAYRIPEEFFILISVLGAGIGIMLGGMLFRHKTRKKKFYIWIVAVTALQLIYAVLLLRD
jgi:uncharacterized membrane protein YsdA (DUF1294 family)